MSARFCRCGRPLDVLGHHRAACGTAGGLGRRGWVLENVEVRVCREAGGRFRVNVFVRDMDLHDYNRLDRRRLEAVDGLPLWNGAQLATDTTMVSPVRRDGSARQAHSHYEWEIIGRCQNSESEKIHRTVQRKRQSPSPFCVVSPLPRPEMRLSPLEAAFALGCATARAFAQSLFRGSCTRRRGWSHPFHERRVG